MRSHPCLPKNLSHFSRLEKMPAEAVVLFHEPSIRNVESRNDGLDRCFTQSDHLGQCRNFHIAIVDFCSCSDEK